MTPSTSKHTAFAGRLVMIGFGCIGQGALPLLLRHIEMTPAQVLVIAPDNAGLQLARAMGAEVLAMGLTRDNLQAVLGPRLRSGDFMLNLSVNVSTIALMLLCKARRVLYLDTRTEPWAGAHSDASVHPSRRTNYALRESALAQRNHGGPTALLTHGANPGLVSHFVKHALLDLAGVQATAAAPDTRAGWAALAQGLDVRAIHISERDTQVSDIRKAPDEFVNTWSAEAFVDEGIQPAELGWGTHETHFPLDGLHHEAGCRASIYLNRPGASTRVRSWTPLSGPIHGFLITHSESISIADYLTIGTPARPDYRPTVHCVYHPCDDAVLSIHELAARNWRMQSRQRVLKDEIVSGTDELGVLLMSGSRGAYWYGSQLSITQARQLCPHNSATSLQAAAAVMAGAVWAMKNPACDVVEPDDLPHEDILALARPYLGELVGVHTDWTPLQGRSALFREKIDLHDPWQFKNVRVT
jgi:homospermidine synthase